MLPDFFPTASIESLKRRSQMLKAIRLFFDKHGFFEVETPLISQDICVDRHLHPIALDADQVTGVTEPPLPEKLWLQTSPEFGMKRILAAGADAIYQISKCFRFGERGNLHNPEFTMLEWYRTGDGLETGMDFLALFIDKLLGLEGEEKVQRKSYRSLFTELLAIDPFESSVLELYQCCESNGLDCSGFSRSNDDRDFWLNYLLTTIIEPRLGVGRPLIIYDWPATQAALSIIRPDKPPVAERFELYIDGLEIANGYHELRDAEELRQRNHFQNQLRARDGNGVLPSHSRLIQAMEFGLPACAGVALGIDRLMMCLAGSRNIKDVIVFPIERA